MHLMVVVSQRERRASRMKHRLKMRGLKCATPLPQNDTGTAQSDIVARNNTNRSVDYSVLSSFSGLWIHQHKVFNYPPGLKNRRGMIGGCIQTIVFE